MFKSHGLLHLRVIVWLFVVGVSLGVFVLTLRTNILLSVFMKILTSVKKNRN